MKKVLFGLIAMGSLAAAANAAIIGEFIPVLTEGGNTPPSGFKTQDLQAVATTDWTGGNLIVTLTSGSIYQDAFGDPAGNGVNAAFFPLAPSLRWDTYVSGAKAYQAPSSAGGAVDLGGAPTAKFDTAGINKNWFTTDTNDVGTFPLGRFTLSDNAQGTFKLRLDSVGQTAPLVIEGFVVDGIIGGVIPEPASLSLLGLGAMGLVARRRRA